MLPAVGQLERADLPWLLDGYQLAVATQFTPAMVAPVAERWPVWRMFAALGERLGLDVLGGGLTAETATDEPLLRPLAERSRGGADAVFAARQRCRAQRGGLRLGPPDPARTAGGSSRRSRSWRSSPQRCRPPTAASSS